MRTASGQENLGVPSPANSFSLVESPPPSRITPGPAGVVSLDVEADPISFLGHLIEQYGDVVRYQTRFGPCFVFVHPEHVQAILHDEKFRRASLVKMMLGDGLLASDGPVWRSRRKLMQRDFFPVNVAPFVSVMARETSRLADTWAAAGRTGNPIDISTAMTRLTLQIVVEALFSVDLSETCAAELCTAITRTINDLSKISWTIFGVPVNLTPNTNTSFAAGKKVVDAVCLDMIARRKAQSPADRPPDLLTMLIEAETDAGPLTDLQLRDEMVTMLVGGHETTALALAWAWKALAENPDVEARLHAEVDEVLRGRQPTLLDMPNLPWTRAVFQEAMRLYPPVWYIARVAEENDTVGGHAIPRGACILVSAWFTHRHKDFWPDADRFDPGRFMNPAAKPAHRYAYFPFGGGRHQCIGMHFALLEGTLILAQLARQFRVLPLPNRQILPDPGITLRQSPSLLATLETRCAQRVPALAGLETF